MRFCSLFPYLLALVLLGLPEDVKSYGISAMTFLWSRVLTPMRTDTTVARENPSYLLWADLQEQEHIDRQQSADLLWQNRYEHIVTKMIFQPTAPWGNTVWVDVGYKTSPLPIGLQRNCPVLSGDVAVGLVDFVGAYASRVRLLSDPLVHPAVQIRRQGVDIHGVQRAVSFLQETLKKHPDIMPSRKAARALFKLLSCCPCHLSDDKSTRFARGELQGAEKMTDPSMWKGVGFALEISADGKGGVPIRVGDVLETSGLDGLFPQGLIVAKVTSVAPTEEGATTFHILARSEAENFLHLDYLTILAAQPQEVFHVPTLQDSVSDRIAEEENL